jgi:hypothetical protein
MGYFPEIGFLDEEANIAYLGDGFDDSEQQPSLERAIPATMEVFTSC